MPIQDYIDIVEFILDSSAFLTADAAVKESFLLKKLWEQKNSTKCIGFFIDCSPIGDYAWRVLYEVKERTS
jgi:hypothetical protein